MRRALDLARAGIALSSPNPHVGAVVLDASGAEAGSGTYTYAGKTHAEVIALEAAGERARGGTLYLNLEPCSHTGRTGPCAEAVARAGVRRVVAAMADPNPKVSGAGFAQLQAAGIQVEIGLLEAEARKLNEGFAKFITHGTPLVTLKAGMTLDGKIAPPPLERSLDPSPAPPGAGTSTGGWITSSEAREHVQALRHAADAILVGVGTVFADDPLLTDRTGRDRRRPLLRVIFDSRLRLPLTSRIVTTAKDDVIVFCAFAEENKKAALEAHGVRVEQLPIHSGARTRVSGGPSFRSSDGRPDMRALTRRLGELEITGLLIEGGSLINWSALAAGIVDKVFLYYAPKILGGSGSVPFAAGEGFQHLSDAARLQNIEIHRFSEDFAVEGYLHDPYAHSSAPAPTSGPRLVTENG